MAFSGKITAANHAGLLTKVTDFITDDSGTPGRDWAVARQDLLTWGPATAFRNTGLSGSEEVYVGFCAVMYADGMKGGFVCKVHKVFDSTPGGTGFLDTAYGNGMGQNGTYAFLPCWDVVMNVRVWSNKACVVIVVECNGAYANAYLGQLRRFSLLNENPWSLVCLTGGYTSLWQYTTWHDAITNTGSRSADLHRRDLAFVRWGSFPLAMTFPYYHACHQICRPDGVWTSHFIICPTISLLGSSSGYETDMKVDTQRTGIVFPEGTPRLLLPMYVIQFENTGDYTGASAIGEMYRVCWAPDSLAGIESDVDGYILFPDVDRMEWHSFMTIGDE